MDGPSTGLPQPALPVTWRPRLGRVVPYVLAVAALAGFVTVALILNGEGPSGARLLDRVLLVAFGVFVAFMLHRYGSVRVTADDEGLVVRNLLRSRRLEWAEVLNVRLAPGDPWVYLDLADGTSLAAMGIQGADGARGRAQAIELAALVAGRSLPEG
jgi:hypothetical protein